MKYRIRIQNLPEAYAAGCYFMSPTYLKDVQSIAKKLFSNHQSFDQIDKNTMDSICLETIRKGIVHYYNNYRGKLGDGLFVKELKDKTREFKNSMHESPADKFVLNYISIEDCISLRAPLTDLPREGRERISTEEDLELLTPEEIEFIDFMLKLLRC